jgi:hypothetical protein
MPRPRGNQAIEFAPRYQHVVAAERAADPPAGATALALVLDGVTSTTYKLGRFADC